ncbi:hypothetical protein N0V95_009875 [Ascochyta clinopodiicola]|nr:hypothetical protein N0V95_009875 [Ascochyta clinopodiicola]
MTDKDADETYEQAVKLTIYEKRRISDSTQEILHQDVNLILVAPDTATLASPATIGPKLAPGAIAGICFGALLGAVLLGMLCFSCCGTVGDAERRRSRGEGVLREQGEVDEGGGGGVVTVPTRAAAREEAIGVDEIRGVREWSVEGRWKAGDGLPLYEVLPPKYTP